MTLSFLWTYVNSQAYFLAGCAGEYIEDVVCRMRFCPMSKLIFSEGINEVKMTQPKPGLGALLCVSVIPSLYQALFAATVFIKK